MDFFRSLTTTEKSNLFKYISGIMCFKFSSDAVMHGFTHIIKEKAESKENLWWAFTMSLNIAAQLFGLMLVSPLVYRFRVQYVLCCSILCMGFISFLVAFFKKDLGLAVNIIIYACFGSYQGVLELVRRITPQKIIGSNSVRLKQFDSTVHILYEVAGVSGTIVNFIITSNGYSGDFSFYLFAVLSIVSCGLWLFLDIEKPPVLGATTPSILMDLAAVFANIIPSITTGFRFVVGRRELRWLIPCYCIPLLLHRYLESIFMSQYATEVFLQKDWRLLLVAGSNFGELCGALVLLFLASKVHSPLPWLRLDSLSLFLSWLFINEHTNFQKWVSIFICSAISFGFASGDVSVAAFIQSKIKEEQSGQMSLLASSMSFLHASYIILFALFSIPMNALADQFRGNYDNLRYASSIGYSVLGVVVFLATFYPKGACSWNPTLLSEEPFELNDVEKPKPQDS